MKASKEDIAEERLAVEVVANREVAVKEEPATEGAIQESITKRLPYRASKETETTRATLKDGAS